MKCGWRWPKKKKKKSSRKSVNSFICMLHLVAQSIFIQKKYFLAQNLNSSGCSHVSSFSTNGKQKRLALDIFDIICHTFQLCLWCHWYNLLGTKWQHSQSCFRIIQIDKKDQNSNETLLCIYLKKCKKSVPIHRACDTSSLWFPFNKMFLIQHCKHCIPVSHYWITYNVFERAGLHTMFWKGQNTKSNGLKAKVCLNVSTTMHTGLQCLPNP